MATNGRYVLMEHPIAAPVKRGEVPCRRRSLNRESLKGRNRSI